MKYSRTKSQQAFTIVELIIVVVVIAILATVSIIGYNGIKKSAVDSQVKDSVSQVRKKMLLEGIKNGESYPTTFPSGINLGSNIGLALTTVGTDKEFCINGTTPDYNDVYYHATQTEAVSTGLCPGVVLAPSIIGNYNSNAGTNSYTFSRTVTGNGTLGLTVHVGEAWNSVDITWDSQPDAVRYELKARDPSSVSTSAKTFYYRLIADGSGGCSTGTSDTSLGTGCGSSYSGMIPAGTTSLSWSDTTNGIPRTAGQAFEYEIRLVRADNSYSAWDVASLSNYIDDNATIPAVTNFTATANTAYTQNTLDWNQVDNFAPHMDQVFYELQARNPASNSTSAKTFYYRLIADGSGGCTTGTSDTSVGVGCGTSYSGVIPFDTSSLVWTDSTTGVPKLMGQDFDYRIRVRVTGQKSYTSVWSDMKTVSYPVQSNLDIPAVSNFTVTANGAYTNATLSWDQVANFAPDMSQVVYEIKSRNPASNSSSTNTFYYRTIADGSSSCSTGTSDTSIGIGCPAGFSGSVPYTTTSLTWTDPATGVPMSAGQTFEYRMRVRVTGESSFYGPWTNVQSVVYPIQSNSDIPAVSNFTVTPNAGFTNVTLSWNQVSNFAPYMGQVFYELKARNPASTSTSAKTFYYRLIADGSSGCSTGTSDTSIGTGCGSSYSGMIPYTTNSLIWTDSVAAVPTLSGQTYQYEIRTRISGESSYYSAWSTQSVSH